MTAKFSKKRPSECPFFAIPHPPKNKWHTGRGWEQNGKPQLLSSTPTCTWFKFKVCSEFKLEKSDRKYIRIRININADSDNNTVQSLMYWEYCCSYIVHTLSRISQNHPDLNHTRVGILPKLAAKLWPNFSWQTQPWPRRSIELRMPSYQFRRQFRKTSLFWKRSTTPINLFLRADFCQNLRIWKM